jgi:hypothetical protein
MEGKDQQMSVTLYMRNSKQDRKKNLKDDMHKKTKDYMSGWHIRC